MKIRKSVKKYLFVFSFLSALIPVILSGCGGITPPKSMIPPTYVKPTAKNGGIASKPVLGSLWSSSNGADLYADNVALRINDTVTVIINNRTRVSDSSGIVLSHTSSGKGSIAFGSLSTSKPTGYDGLNAEKFNGGGGVSESGNISTMMQAQVVKVFPNGNIELKGEREVSVNGETRYLLIEGVVRPTNISQSNTILSSQISDLRVWMNGKGYINSQQNPNWLYKAMEYIWPF